MTCTLCGGDLCVHGRVERWASSVSHTRGRELHLPQFAMNLKNSVVVVVVVVCCVFSYYSIFCQLDTIRAMGREVLN